MAVKWDITFTSGLMSRDIGDFLWTLDELDDQELIYFAAQVDRITNALSREFDRRFGE